MPGWDFSNRKVRTRDHIIADQSMNHVERFVYDAGFVAHRFGSDYGYDLAILTFDDQGRVEPEWFFVQLKASLKLTQSGRHFVCTIDRRDYNLWVNERMPVILILYDATRRRAYWLHFQGSVRGDASKPKPGAKTFRVRVPVRQRLNEQAIRRMRSLKIEALERGDEKWRS